MRVRPANLVFALALALPSAALAQAQPSPSQPPPAASSGAPSRIGPSFNCSEAGQHPLAQAICASPKLSRLDLRFAQAFFALKQQVGPAGQSDLVQQAVNFTSSVETACGVAATGAAPTLTAGLVSCVAGAYHRQRDAWLAQLSGAAKQEATRPLRQHLSLQRDLQILGFLPASAPIDGVYGTGTRAAITAWQNSAGRPATGFLADAAAAALAEAAAGNATAAAGLPEPDSAAAAPAAVSAPSGVLASWSGAGERALQPFHAPGPWVLRWVSTDPDPILEVLDMSGNVAGGASGAPSGQSFQPSGGDFYLQVNANGIWKIEAVTLTESRASAWPPPAPPRPAPESAPAPTPPPASAAAAEQTAAPSVASGNGPAAETAFIRVVQEARAKYNMGSNDLTQGAARVWRKNEICQTLKGFHAHGWVGTVDTLSSSSDGKGVLGVRIARHITVETQNNELSDALEERHTLIGPSSPVFAEAQSLKSGEAVTFSGQFMTSQADCVEESSLTQGGSMTDPELIFRFTNVAPSRPAEGAQKENPDKT